MGRNQRMARSIKQSGFSLVELSIVLVILGLLTGGILAGQSLIRASELRAVTTEYNRWIAATQTFRDKYFAVPGDFRDATKFWGISTACAGASATGTCDGTGDGLFGNGGGASSVGEMFMYWQQLALAGLVEGTYTGISGTGGGPHAVIGTNVPRSKIATAGWSLASFVPAAGDVTNYFASDYGNVFFYGAATAGNVTAAGALRPEEAWNIDTKLDDGKPSSGGVMTGKLGSVFLNSCSTTATASTAEYALTTTAACAIIFKTKF